MRELITIPKEYQTLEDKLKWLSEESIREQKRDRMNLDYTYRLWLTNNYWTEVALRDNKINQIIS
jgi:hypothetical protein